MDPYRLASPSCITFFLVVSPTHPLCSELQNPRHALPPVPPTAAAPAACTGRVRRQVGKASGPGRREVGHGNLAERALAPVLPPAELFPWAVRVNAETLGSNGSSSMAAVCGGAMALRNAGVPLRALVAGVSVGLVTER